MKFKMELVPYVERKLFRVISNESIIKIFQEGILLSETNILLLVGFLLLTSLVKYCAVRFKTFGAPAQKI